MIVHTTWIRSYDVHSCFQAPYADLLSCSSAGFALRLGSGPGLSFLWQHRVSGRALLPGAAMFEAAHAAGTSLLGLPLTHTCA